MCAKVRLLCVSESNRAPLHRKEAEVGGGGGREKKEKDPLPLSKTLRLSFCCMLIYTHVHVHTYRHTHTQFRRLSNQCIPERSNTQSLNGGMNAGKFS